MENYIFICEFCDNERKSAKSLIAHRSTCRNNPNRKIPWNNGLTAETNEIIADSATLQRGQVRESIRGSKHPNYGKQFGSSITGHSDNTRATLSVVAKNRGLGGYNPGAGRGKKGWYKGIFCDSSWELAYLIWCLDHNIKVERCTEKFEYLFNGKILRYYPDFIVNGKIVEVKGYKTTQWLEKLKQCPVSVEVLYEEELKPIISYVKSYYGKDYINKYE